MRAPRELPDRGRARSRCSLRARFKRASRCLAAIGLLLSSSRPLIGASAKHLHLAGGWGVIASCCSVWCRSGGEAITPQPGRATRQSLRARPPSHPPEEHHETASLPAQPEARRARGGRARDPGAARAVRPRAREPADDEGAGLGFAAHAGARAARLRRLPLQPHELAGLLQRRADLVARPARRRPGTHGAQLLCLGPTAEHRRRGRRDRRRDALVRGLRATLAASTAAAGAGSRRLSRARRRRARRRRRRARAPPSTRARGPPGRSRALPSARSRPRAGSTRRATARGGSH